LVKEIARGGMGVVYKARQVSLDRLVAVKMILAGEFATPAFVQRFRTEASAAALLRHPNIVAIHEVGVHAGQHYFSMDFVDGPSLAALVGHVPLPARRAAQYVKTIAEAIHYAHQQGILHRDLKPSNVLIDANDQPHITDFGLAKRLEGETSLMLSGQMVGSPNFMPPEQATAKHGKVGRYSDVYALGGILYHLLTARPPFQADSLEVIVSQVLTAEPVSPRMLNPAVPRDLETVCLKCLEKEPFRRYATAQALADELGRFLRGEPILARPLGPTGKVWRWCQRQPVRAGLLAALVLVLFLGLSGVLWQWRRAERQRSRAEDNELLYRQNAYAADMRLVQRALDDGDVGRAIPLLDEHRPATLGNSSNRGPRPETDLRGWEWRYFWAHSRSDERFTLHQYSNSVSALAYSPDGHRLAVRLGSGAVVLWDPVGKQQITNFPGAFGDRALAFSPQGELLAWGNKDDTGAPVLSLWDLAVNKEVARLPHSNHVVSVAFSPDAKVLATLAWDGVVRLWEIQSQREVTNFSSTKMIAEQSGYVLFSPDGKTLVIGEPRGGIRRFDWRTGGELPLLPAFRTAKPGLAGGITALAFSPDGKYLAAACWLNSQVYLWDLKADDEATMLSGHTAWIRALAFSPDSGTLASASADRTVRLWDVRRKTPKRRLQGHLRDINALAWSADGKDLASGSEDGSVRYWDPALTPDAIPYQKLSSPIELFALAFSPDSGRMITVRRADGAVVLWDAASLREIETLAFVGTNQLSVALSPDGRLLAVTDRVGRVRVWDFPARGLLKVLPSNPGDLCELTFSARGHLLRAHVWEERTGGCRLKLWDVATFAEIRLEGVNLKDLWLESLDPNGRLLAIPHRDGTVNWWDITSKPPHAALEYRESGWDPCVAFSPDGRWFASASVRGAMTVWDLAQQPPHRLAWTHLNKIVNLTFSPDGRRLITGGESSRDVVKLWDPESGRELAALTGEPGTYYGGTFYGVGFSPDGNTLYAGSFSGTLLLWRAPSFADIEAAEKGRASR
jgi:WD40 repeat protein/predicted Ser/Thr protein kinase